MSASTCLCACCERRRSERRAGRSTHPLRACACACCERRRECIRAARARWNASGKPAEHKVRKIQAGLCHSCSAPAMENRAACETHLNKQRDAYKLKKATQRRRNSAQ